MESWSEGLLQHPALTGTAITFATLTGKNYLGEGNILENAGAVCFCMEKRRHSALGCQNDSVWASECWSNPVHVMRFTLLDCQHKQAQANLKRKRWKISHVIKTCFQMHLQLFLLHWQIMILSALLLSWSRQFCNILTILQKCQSVQHSCSLNAFGFR